MNLLVFPTVRPAEAQNTNTSPKSVPMLLSPQMCAESHLNYISLLIIPCIIYHVTNKETLKPWTLNSINLMPSRTVTSLKAIYHASPFLFLRPIIFDSSQQLWHCGFVSINEQELVWLMHHFTVKPNYATLSIHTALNGHIHPSFRSGASSFHEQVAYAHIHASRHTHPSNKNTNRLALFLTLRSS